MSVTHTYRYFRFQPTAIRTPAGVTIQMSEFALLSGSTRLTGMTITATGSTTGAGEEPDKAGDDNTATKWCNTAGLPCTLVYDFGTATSATGYRWATANDATGRDPVSWIVSGSSDGSTWTVLDSRSSYATTTDRLTFLDDFGFGTPVLAGSSHTLILDVEVAWGADLTAAASTWTWSSITADVLVDGGEQVTYSLGKQDEASVSQPAECRLRLDNREGGYSLGPQASNWPYVRRGTPLRLRVSGDVSTVVYSGFVDSWQPDWDTSGEYAVVNVTASGVLRRLQQHNPPVISPIRRAMRDLIGGNLIAYWPMEDNKDAIYCSSDIPGHPPMQVSDIFADGVPKFADAAPFACSAPIVNMDFSYMYGLIPPYTDTNELQARQLIAFPKEGMNNNTQILVLGMDLSTSTVQNWVLRYGTGGTLQLVGFDVDGGSVAASSVFAFDVDGLRLRVGFSLVQDGADIDFEISTYAPGAPSGSFASGTFTSVTLGVATSVDLIPAANGEPIIGHVTMQNEATNIFSDLQELNAWSGEGAVDRIGRLVVENNIPYTIVTDASPGPAMGAQSVASVLDLLRECEIADQGILYDGEHDEGGISYHAHNAIVNLALHEFNANNGRIRSVDVVDDDQQLRNRVTASRTGGGTITDEDTDGPLGTAAVGIYDDSVTINCETDAQLPDYAGWLIHTGTVEGYRYPRVEMDLRDLNSTQVSFLLTSIRPGRRIDLINLATYRPQLPTARVLLAPYGWTARLDKHRWTYQINAGPYEPWRVVELEDSEYGLQADTAGSTLASDASAGATSLSVATSTGPLWSTDSGDYPTTVEVGDLQVTVSAVSGGSSPQTFTCSATALARPAGVTVQLPRSTPVIDIDDTSGD